MAEAAQRFSLGEVNVAPEGALTLALGQIAVAAGGVNLEEYSRFKHGDGEAAASYGAMLAREFVEVHPSTLNSEPLLVTSSAYKVAPSAAHSLVAPFVAELQRITGTQTNANAFKIDRAVLTDGDYASLSVEERQQTMERNGLSLPEGLDLRGQSVVLLDDILVTGSHEVVTRKLLDEASAKAIYCGYILRVNGGESFPEVEALINTQVVRNVDDILAITQEPNFIPNARLCKFILSRPITEIARFCDEAPPETVKTVKAYIRGDGLDTMLKYSETADALLRHNSSGKALVS